MSAAMSHSTGKIFPEVVGSRQQSPQSNLPIPRPSPNERLNTTQGITFVSTVAATDACKNVSRSTSENLPEVMTSHQSPQSNLPILYSASDELPEATQLKRFVPNVAATSEVCKHDSHSTGKIFPKVVVTPQQSPQNNLPIPRQTPNEQLDTTHGAAFARTATVEYKNVSRSTTKNLPEVSSPYQTPNSNLPISTSNERQNTTSTTISMLNAAATKTCKNVSQSTSENLPEIVSSPQQSLQSNLPIPCSTSDELPVTIDRQLTTFVPNVAGKSEVYKHDSHSSGNIFPEVVVSPQQSPQNNLPIPRQTPNEQLDNTHGAAFARTAIVEYKNVSQSTAKNLPEVSTPSQTPNSNLPIPTSNERQNTTSTTRSIPNAAATKTCKNVSRYTSKNLSEVLTSPQQSLQSNFPIPSSISDELPVSIDRQLTTFVPNVAEKSEVCKHDSHSTGNIFPKVVSSQQLPPNNLPILRQTSNEQLNTTHVSSARTAAATADNKNISRSTSENHPEVVTSCQQLPQSNLPIPCSTSDELLETTPVTFVSNVTATSEEYICQPTISNASEHRQTSVKLTAGGSGFTKCKNLSVGEVNTKVTTSINPSLTCLQTDEGHSTNSISQLGQTSNSAKLENFSVQTGNVTKCTARDASVHCEDLMSGRDVYQVSSTSCEEQSKTETAKRVNKIDFIRDIPSEDDIRRLRVGELKSILKNESMSYDKCTEKDELEKKVTMIWKELKKRELRENPEAVDVCKICLENIIDCVLLDCGHMTSCVECGHRLKECPICREYIVRVVRIFRC